MTIVSTSALIASTATSAIVSEFSGGRQSSVAMTIGIGLVKDSDAVFFKYADEAGEQPVALLQPSGKHLSTLCNVTLVDVSLYEPNDEYNTLKLNVTLESSTGTHVMVTSGLTTFWSMSILGGLLEMQKGGDLTCPFNLDTWRGNKGKIKPCFGAIKMGAISMRNDDLYNSLTDARSDGNKQLVERIMRDGVETVHHALTGGLVEEAVVTLDAAVSEVPADF